MSSGGFDPSTGYPEGMRLPVSSPAVAVATQFRRLARLRSARAFHPDGRVGSGTLQLDDGSSAVGEVLGAGAHPVRVRLSRGAGLPGPLPDLLGIAVRVEGERPLDLLFTTVARPGVAHWLLVPARRWTARPYSTVLPYRTPRGRRLLALAPVADELPDASMHSLELVGPSRPLVFDLLEGPLTGPWRTIGGLSVDGFERDESIAFDPMLNADPRLRPVRFLSTTREAAYDGSRWGRRGR